VPDPRPQSEAQQLLASIVQSSHDAIVALGMDLTILSWNPGAERLYGHTAQQALGQHADLFVPADQRSDLRELVALVVAGGRIDRFLTRWQDRDGQPLTLALAVSPLRDDEGRAVGVTTFARDLSEGERGKARLMAVLDAAPDAIVAIDAVGQVVLANSRAEQLFGRYLNELIGAPIDRLVPGGLPDTAEGAAVAEARRSDGTLVAVEITVSVTEVDGGRLRCAVLRDITDRLRGQAEQQRLRAVAERDRLDAQLQRAQRLESLGQLAGGVAHDFNNLVGVILSYAEFVIEQATGEGDLTSIAADAQQVARAAHRASELTHQLLSFARREVVRAEVLDLNGVVRQVEQLLRRTVGEHIGLRTVLATVLPPIWADAGQLEQVLVNLAVNARDAMPQGGTLTVSTDVMPAGDFSDDAAGGFVRLRVTDSGSGMPREVIERAFEPFYSTKQRGEGSGLGLATVYGIVTQAGGDVRIESSLGMGTTISVLLPATEQVGRTEPEPVGPVTAGVRGETILLVEDEHALREVAARTLRGAGYEVLLAADGAAALELARAHPGPIQLMVSDVVMPGMQGKELAGRLAVSRPGTRVLYVSGYARPVLASRGTLEPGVALLTKPFSRDELLTAVRRRLDEIC